MANMLCHKLYIYDISIKDVIDVVAHLEQINRMEM